MVLLKRFALSGVMCVALASPAFAEVQLTIGGGRVSLVAKDATVRQILAEWQRVGQTKIVNVDRIPGGPVTLELKDVPEEQALDLLLRSVSGYMAAPRASAMVNGSQFDRIIVMPTSVPPRAVAAASPSFAQPVQPSPFMPQQDEMEEGRVAPNVPMPQGRGPIFNTFPQPQIVNPPQQGVPSSVPGVVAAPTQPQTGAPAVVYPGMTPSAQPTVPFGGVAVPGMIVQPPQQPGQVQPGQPQRPDGQH